MRVWLFSSQGLQIIYNTDYLSTCCRHSRRHYLLYKHLHRRHCLSVNASHKFAHQRYLTNVNKFTSSQFAMVCLIPEHRNSVKMFAQNEIRAQVFKHNRTLQAFVPRLTSYRSAQESLPSRSLKLLKKISCSSANGLNCGLVNWYEFPTGIETDKFPGEFTDLNITAAKMIHIYYRWWWKRDDWRALLHIYVTSKIGKMR